MTKFKEYFENMLKVNKKLFDDFKLLHDQYALDPDTWQEEFNKKGEPILTIIRQWEDKLCNRSEGTGYANFSPKLAEKFQKEVKREFPQIDRVGLTIFSINKINL